MHFQEIHSPLPSAPRCSHSSSIHLTGTQSHPGRSCGSEVWGTEREHQPNSWLHRFPALFKLSRCRADREVYAVQEKVALCLPGRVLQVFFSSASITRNEKKNQAQGKTCSPLYPSFPHHHPKIPFRIPSRNCCSNLNNYLESSAAINHLKTNSARVL